MYIHVRRQLHYIDYVLSFIYSFRIFLYSLFESTTIQKHSRLQHGYCVGVNTSKRYTTGNSQWRTCQISQREARVKFEPATFRSHCSEITNKPPRPTSKEIETNTLITYMHPYINIFCIKMNNIPAHRHKLCVFSTTFVWLIYWALSLTHSRIYEPM